MLRFQGVSYFEVPIRGEKSRLSTLKGVNVDPQLFVPKDSSLVCFEKLGQYSCDSTRNLVRTDNSIPTGTVQKRLKDVSEYVPHLRLRVNGFRFKTKRARICVRIGFGSFVRSDSSKLRAKLKGG